MVEGSDASAWLLLAGGGALLGSGRHSTSFSLRGKCG
jgi:hypothetical protein